MGCSALVSANRRLIEAIETPSGDAVRRARRAVEAHGGRLGPVC